MLILVGSRALALRAPALLTRKPVDFDYICNKENFDKWILNNSYKINIKHQYSVDNKIIIEGNLNFEFEISTPNSSAELLLSIVSNDPETLDTPFGKIPNLDLLFSLKSSHKYLKNSNHFWKTLKDYHILKHYGAKIRPEYQTFYELREKETYTYKHPKLNQSKNKFFSNDNVNYLYDHDSIHRSVAIGEKPAYKYYLKNNAEVQCDKKKFFELPEQIRINGVIEEVSVLAIERALVPKPKEWTAHSAWMYSFSKVCTSITSGWFREFAYDNAIKILNQYPENYWEKFKTDLFKGKILSYSS
jgi:hypothetical protein